MMNMKRIRSLAWGVGVTLMLQGAAWASDWPQRQVKIVVPFSPGGGIDVLARTTGQRLAERWDVPVVVENRPGASGNIGTQAVVSAEPDGYTLMMTVSTLAMAPSLFPSVRFDPQTDLTAVGETALGSLALVANPASGIRTFNDLVTRAQAQPGALNYASPGSGTPHHLAMELVKRRAGIDLQHVPYKGSAGALTDLVGGQVHVGFMPIHQVLQQVRSGQLVLLAAGGTRRSEVTPDTPSLAEASGYSDVDVDMWYGLFAPAGLPADILSKINQDLNAVLQMPEVIDTLNQQGLSARTSTPQALQDVLAKDLARWKQIIVDAGIRAQ